MVKYLLLTLLPSFIYAGSFTASVSSSQVPLGESFILDLTLKDASEKNGPDFNPIRKEFIIHSKQQSSSTIMINGKISSSKSWRLTLIPKKEGESTVPKVGIETNAGILFSKPIKIFVAKGANSAEDRGSQGQKMALTAIASNPFPYKNEPFTYTIKLAAEQEIANVKIENFSIDNAIVDTIEKPAIEEEVINGIRRKVITFRYLITPVKPGNLTIPPIVIQGGTPERRKKRISPFFDIDSDMDPFGMLRGFQQLKPFALSTDEIPIEVQPPVPEVNPWLVARSLKIDEKQEDTQNIQEGEPFILSVVVTAEGLRAAQLPNIGELMRNTSAYNIYADNPELNEQMADGKIQSVRKEQFTIIPQKSGTLTLPAISIPWWDPIAKEKKVAAIFAKTWEVKPAPSAKQAPSHPISNAATPGTAININSSNQQTINYLKIPLTYIAIAALLLLLGAVIWIINLQSRLSRLTKNGKKPNTQKVELGLSIDLKKLEEAASVEEIRDFIQSWGDRRWGLPKNGSIRLICEEAKKRCPENCYNEIASLEKTLEEALYKNANIPIKETAMRFARILEQAKAKSFAKEQNNSLPKLNPT